MFQTFSKIISELLIRKEACLTNTQVYSSTRLCNLIPITKAIQNVDLYKKVDNFSIELHVLHQNKSYAERSSQWPYSENSAAYFSLIG